MIIKDPLALSYYRLLPAEYHLLTCLDGSLSLEQLQRNLQNKFPAQAFPLRDLDSLIHRFLQQGLLVNTNPGQGWRLLRQRDKRRKQQLLQTLSSVLTIKLPGADPTRLLDIIYPWLRWCFSPACLLLSATLIISTILLAIVQLPELRRELPDFQSFFAGENLVAVALILASTKLVHELGHALVCRHYGGHCRSIGVMFLVFVPTLYCDTTDAWTLASKWKRIAVSAAGMVSELVVAAIATWIWWTTHTGWLHFTCLNVMIVCGVSTVLFNGNPLLRYDAYYMLSDFLEIPNLASKSRLALLNFSRYWLLGVPFQTDSRLPARHRLWFILYSVASWVYRWIVVFSILWFLNQWFQPYGLEVVGRLLIVAAIVSMIGRPTSQLVRYFRHPANRMQIRPRRVLTTTAVLAALTSAFFLLPLPYSIIGTATLQPADAEKIYIKAGGRLIESLVPIDQEVRRGQQIVRLDTTTLELQVLRLEYQKIRLEELIRQRTRLVHLLDRGKADLARQQEEWTRVKLELSQRKTQLQNMKVSAPRDGTILTTTNNPRQLPTSAIEAWRELPTWWGGPLDPCNRGAFCEAETTLCWVGSPERWQAEIYVSQQEIPLVSNGQTVTLLLDAYPQRPISGTVYQISPEPVRVIPPHLAANHGGPLQVQPDASPNGRSRPLFQWYQVSVKLNDSQRLLNGMQGQAKIHLPRTTLAQRVYRWASGIIRFR